ncbi:MAG TPA: hypothetical protein VMZ53_20200 [Kofleriaceae bacterium]|nr:hypothetical protein [Kofleriaceae bacterium]
MTTNLAISRRGRRRVAIPRRAATPILSRWAAAPMSRDGPPRRSLVMGGRADSLAMGRRADL